MQYAVGMVPRTKYDVRTFPEGPFPRAVTALRKGSGLSQEKAARLLDVTLSTVSKWERGEVTPQPMVQDTVVARLRAVAKPKPRKPRAG